MENGIKMTRLGYACINLSIPCSPSLNMRKNTFLSKGKEYAGALALNNVKMLSKIFQWNEDNNIRVYRMSSDMIPWMSEYELNELPQFNEISPVLSSAGALARKYGHRLSFHPGPFNQLASMKSNVVTRTIKELNQHSEIMDLMGFPANHMTKINIHVGNAAEGKADATNRFCENFKLLNDGTKKRLVVENDDKSGLYTMQELYELVHKKIGVPLTFDYLHHYCNPGTLTEKEALTLAVSTWGEVTPCAHYSSSKKLCEDNTAKLLSHADYVYNVIDTYGFDLDIVIEAKAKDLATLSYVKKHSSVLLN